MLAKNSLSSRTARNPRKGSDSSFDAGMILCLSSSDDEIDLVKQKIQDIRVIQEIPEIYISDDSSDDLDILNETTRVNTRSRVPTSLRNPPKHKSHSSLERNRKDDVNLLLSTVMGENKAKAKEISNLKTELAECQQKLDDLLTEGGDEDDPRNTRIKQLSKRNKRLIVAFEKEKTKNSSLQEQIDTFRAATDKKSDLTVGETKLAKLASELKSIKEKNAYSARKLEEERISNQSLRSEVRTLTKVLHQELGDGMQLERILKGETNFKGRAEQISILQDKVKELQRKSQLGSKSSSAHKEIMSTNLSKKKEIETLTLKLQDVQNHLKESKRKVDSLLARIRILETQNKELKSKIEILLKKASTDDQLIVVLQDELKRVSTDGNGELGKYKRLSASQSVEINLLKEKLGKMTPSAPKDSISNSDLELDKMRTLIESLRGEVMKLRAEGTKWAQNLLAQKSLAEFNNESKKKELLLNHESLEELQELLLLLRDENETLKHSISEIIESKGQDLEMYQSLLDTARLGLA